MGAYLAHPITKTHPEDGKGNRLEYGASSMQGWRVSQEDAHNCVLDFDGNSSFFAVYDGHGGSEVAVYLSQHLPDFLKATKGYKNGSWKEALSEAYLQIDESIRTPDVLKEIVRLSKFGKSGEDVDGQDDEDVNELFEEATMPIEMLVAKYKDGKSLLEKFVTAKFQESETEKPGSSKIFQKAGGSGKGSPGPGSSDGSSSSSPSKKPMNSSKSEDKELEDQTKESSAQLISTENNKAESGEVSGPTVIKNGRSPIEPDSATNSTHSSNEDYQVETKVNGEGSEEKVKEVNAFEVVRNGTTGNGETKLENDEADSSAASSNIREDSILVVPKKKGKVHQPPVLQLPPKSDDTSPEKRTSPRKNTEKVYMDFLKGEESTSEESEDEDDPTTFGVPVGSDSDDSGEAEAADTSSSDEGEEEEDDEDAEIGEDDEDEDEDDEMLKDYQEPGYDSGATAVTAFTRWEGNKLDLWVANAGDSRCVVSRNGVALEMSEDHKPEDEREALRIVTAGGKVTSEGRVNGGLNLSRAIGDHSYKTNPTLSLKEQMITSLPDVEYAKLDPETDKFMVLACDGIWNSMTSQEVIDFVTARISDSTKKLSQICEELFRACLATDTGGDGTGCDNMTAIIVRLNGEQVEIDGKSIPHVDSSKMDVSVEDERKEVESVDCTTTSTAEKVIADPPRDLPTAVVMASSKRPFNGSPVTPSDSSDDSKRLKLDLDGESI